MKLPALVSVIALAIAPLPRVAAHCDGLDGPVVPAARKALETGDVNLVLIWVQKSDEAEIKGPLTTLRRFGNWARRPASWRTDISLKRWCAPIAPPRARHSQV
jgi:hypothetical protein